FALVTGYSASTDRVQTFDGTTGLVLDVPVSRFLKAWSGYYLQMDESRFSAFCRQSPAAASLLVICAAVLALSLWPWRRNARSGKVTSASSSPILGIMLFSFQGLRAPATTNSPPSLPPVSNTFSHLSIEYIVTRESSLGIEILERDYHLGAEFLDTRICKLDIDGYQWHAEEWAAHEQSDFVPVREALFDGHCLSLSNSRAGITGMYDAEAIAEKLSWSSPLYYGPYF